MEIYNRLQDTYLFLAAGQANGTPLSAYLLPPDSSYDQPSIDFQDSLEKLDGHYIFSGMAIDLSTVELIDAFIKRVYERIEDRLMPTVRAILWIQDPTLGDLEKLPLLGFQSLQKKRQITYALFADLVPDLGISVDNRCRLSFAENCLQLKPANEGTVRLTGNKAFPTPLTQAVIPLAGHQQGCLQLDTVVDQSILGEQLNWGFRYSYEGGSDDQGNPKIESLHFPFSVSEEGDKSFELRAIFDLTDPWNESVPEITGDTIRTGFTLKHGSLIPSGFLSATGQQAILRAVSQYGKPNVYAPGWQSAGLVFQPCTQNSDEQERGFYVTPIGDFQIEIDDKSATPRTLMCGLEGGEALSFNRYLNEILAYEADTIRFYPSHPSFSPLFPIKESSPLEAPVDPDLPTLDGRQLTAWATIRGFRMGGDEQPNYYLTQAKGATLYGKDNFIHDENKEFFGAIKLKATLPRDNAFALPLVGHFGFESPNPDTSISFETGILAKTRQQLIASKKIGMDLDGISRDGGNDDPVPIRATTRSGLIAEIAPDGSWNELNLTKSPSNPDEFLRFTNLLPELRDVFQAAEPFAVIANSEFLGAVTETPAASSTGEPTFQNRVSIGKWSFRIPVGKGNRYGGYQNLLLFKFKRGHLLDLVANPDFWTQANRLSMPEVDSEASELVVLSQWLQDYVKDAVESDDPKYDSFRAMATNPNWTGILALNLEIDTVPPELGGLLRSLESAALRAHHFGITVNQIDPEKIEFAEGNALFALIDYEDPQFDPEAQDPTVPSTANEPYDFRLLQLKVLFENSEIKAFESLAQLTLSQLFGDQVTGINEPGNYKTSIPLNGSFQKQGNTTVYSLDSDGLYQFFVDSKILANTQISKAQFQTDKGDAVFNLWGFLDFAALPDMDLFSFGNSADQTDSAVGLAFNGLSLRFPADRENAPHFETSALAFDSGDSRSRPQSLYRKFPLRIEGLIMECADQQPEEMGFLPVRIPQRFDGLEGGLPWNGIIFGLDLGTPGDLAAAAGFRARLLLAWDSHKPEEANHYPVQVGIQLPGTSGGADVLGIQGALQLAIGDIELSAVPYGDQGRRVYLLKLAEIALSFIGLAKLPPTGATAFYLFVDPKATSNTGGMGWYAVYNKEAEENLTATQIIEGVTR